MMFKKSKQHVKYVRQMPKIYGNLQKPSRNVGGIISLLKNIFWIALIGGVGYIIFFTSIFHVKKVEVQGAVFADSQKISSAVPLGVNIWNISKDQISNKVLLDPIIQGVGVFRGLPDVIRLKVEERKPDLVWISGDLAILVDDSGYAFLQYPKNQPPVEGSSKQKQIKDLPQVIDDKALPVILGHQIVSPKFTLFLQGIQQEMKKNFSAQTIDHFEINDTTYDVTMFLKSGMQVQLNSLGSSEPPIKNLLLLYNQKKITNTSKVDLRIDKWAYVQ